MLLLSLAAVAVRQKHGKVESDEAFDARYESFFNRSDIDGWEIRKAMNDLQVYPVVFFFFANNNS